MNLANRLAGVWQQTIRPSLDFLGPTGMPADIEYMAQYVASNGAVEAAHCFTDAAIRLAALIDEVLFTGKIDPAGFPGTITRTEHHTEPHAIRLVLRILDESMTVQDLKESLGDDLCGDSHRAVILNQLVYAAYAATQDAWHLAESC